MRRKVIEVDDADIMIPAIALREREKLVTLDRDFEFIRDVSGIDVEILEG